MVYVNVSRAVVTDSETKLGGFTLARLSWAAAAVRREFRD